MLLGSDFFLAHHIYVAYSQDKVYFTYNGGPVFDLNALPPARARLRPGARRRRHDGGIECADRCRRLHAPRNGGRFPR